jgi:elongation factor P
MISTGDLKRGMTLDMDGELWSILEFHHIKMGRGSAQVRLKIRNVRTGTTVERSFQAGEKFRRAIVDRKPMQYLYHEDENYYFMDTETFDQILMNASLLGDVVQYLKDQQMIEVQTYGDEPIGAELPPNVDLRVVQTDPGFKGDTASGGTKPATLETGVTVQVPLFVNEGDVIRVDTRSGSYLERV